jgi:coproporphyrinogen III oxidase
MELNKENISNWLQTLQDNICKSLETVDGQSTFSEEHWTRKEGGGGRSRVIKDGAVFEKGGVMFSAVHGDAPDFLFQEKAHALETDKKDKPQFFATGISIVIHPKNPWVPIIHMNIRYFEMTGGVKWLGGGIDLTPHYVIEEDAKFFHQALKTVCDKSHLDYYPRFKKWADDYFYISHRNETRGIGGIFFDRLSTGELSFEQNVQFWQNVGEAFAPIYTELVQRHKQKTFTDAHKQWQLLRRGRYVEFNLVYDKGTKFGLETNGRVESILMSLPALASWEYNFQLSADSEESNTLAFLQKGIEWAGNDDNCK